MMDFETWLIDEGYNQILRAYIHSDEPYMHIKIKKAIELPDGDILIGFQEIIEWTQEEINEENVYLHYRKLSELKFDYCPEDQKIELE